MNKRNSNEIINNNRIHYKYFITKIFESGIVLLGWEVKAIRSKLITIDNSYISFQGYEAFIYNAVFQNQLKSHELIYNPIRTRKLLLKKNELFFLKNQTNKHGYTIVILNLFWKNSWVKAKIGVAKGKKKYDKRHLINTDKWKQEKKYITKCVNN